MTTTTVNAVKVMQQIERLLQVDWPDLDVFATSVTEHWSAAACPDRSRAQVLRRSSTSMCRTTHFRSSPSVVQRHARRTASFRRACSA